MRIPQMNIMLIQSNLISIYKAHKTQNHSKKNALDAEAKIYENVIYIISLSYQFLGNFAS